MTMKKLSAISLTLLVMSCSDNIGPSLFECDLSETGKPAETVAMKVNGLRGIPGINTRSVAIFDTLAISMETEGSSLFSVNDLESGELIGTYCRRGRSLNEMLLSINISQLYKDGNDLKAYVYSYGNSSVFEWNITASVRSGDDVYERIVRLENHDDIEILPLLSCYMVNGQRILARNQKGISRHGMLSGIPVYEAYSLEDGSLLDVYDGIFKHDAMERTDAGLDLSGTDCISPEGDRLAYVLGYLPYMVILDLETGKSKAFRLTGAPSYDPDIVRWYFTSVKADSDRIYALYYGDRLSGGEDFDACPDILYVFGWDGRILKKVELDRHFTDLNIDPIKGRLYLTHRMRGQICYLDISDL